MIDQPDVQTPRVLMLHMPLATPEFPGLGATLLRSILIRDGIECDIRYANLDFAQMLNADLFVERQLGKLSVSEILFTPYYFDRSKESTVDYLANYVGGTTGEGTTIDRDRVRGWVDAAGDLLDLVMRTTDWAAYDIVCFSTMMQQTVASLALAKRLRELHPRLTIVFGGPNASRPMGEEVLRAFPEIDHVIEGEADAVFVDAIREMRRAPGSVLQTAGTLSRDAQGEVVRAQEGTPFTDLSSLPVPDYGPFFQQLEACGLSHVQPYLTIETSRGCWWGQKHHCTFCGIDDEALKFRSKREEDVIEEILTLSARHGLTEFFVVDSIINLKFLRSLLPTLARLRETHGFDFSFFFESKSNLRRDQVEIMRMGGVNAVQPGLENFGDRLLALMDKGTTGARQIQCLRLLTEARIAPIWNWLYRFPGETAEDYDDLIGIIPFLHHIPPLHEEGFVPVLLNRFAPYFEKPDEHGVENIRPFAWYPEVFADASIDHGKLAFYFEYDCETFEDQGLLQKHRDLGAAIRDWREHWIEDSLLQRRGPGFVRIDDRRAESRGGEAIRITLVGVEAEVFVRCDEVVSLAALRTQFGERMPPGELDELIADLQARRLIYVSKSGQAVALPFLIESGHVHRRTKRSVEAKAVQVSEAQGATVS